MKHLLLAGGGHSHVEVVRRFGAAPPERTRVTLVSPDRHTSYSGMLPGFIAGHYAFEESHIDLEPLCRSAQVRFVRSEVSALDLARNAVRLRDGVTESFDLLSLDVGSVPDAGSVPGALEHSVSVKPVPGLIAAWEQLLVAARSAPQTAVIVGGGAGGVELALAMDHRLRHAGTRGIRLAIVTDSAAILPSHPAAARRKFMRILGQRDISLHCARRVVGVAPGVLRLDGGGRLAAHWIVWATAASAAPWLSASGLACDARGFVSVDETLRSISHPRVFAAGDCASLVNRALAKSGVYAVREGPPLAANLRNALAGAPFVRYAPQRRTLSLISTGGRHAVACWGGIAVSGDWAWRWKDRIDRRFVAAYRVSVTG